MIRGTYVSADELEQAGAYTRGYRRVCQHPGEVGEPAAGEVLVIDFDHVLFGDHELAAETAARAARRGVRVGVHTYHPDDPRLAAAAAEPNVAVRKTHEAVLAAVRQPAVYPVQPAA